MKNLRYSPLMNLSLNVKDVYNWMRLPTHYLAESIKDFNESKTHLKHSHVQKLFPSPICYDYALIFLHDVYLKESLNLENKPLFSVNEDGQESRVIEIFDDTGDSTIFWPDRPHSKQGFNDAQINCGLTSGDLVSRLTILHDLNFHNSFIYDILKNKNNYKIKSKNNSYLFNLSPFFNN